MTENESCCHGDNGENRILSPQPIEQQRAEWLAAAAEDEETET